MAGGGSPGVVDGETPENRPVAIASYIAAGKRSEALVEIENLGGPFTDPEQLTRFMHLCLTLAGEELLDGNRTNGLRLIGTAYTQAGCLEPVLDAVEIVVTGDTGLYHTRLQPEERVIVARIVRSIGGGGPV